MSTNLDISAGLANASTTFRTAHSDIFVAGALPGAYKAWTEEVRSQGKLDTNFLANLPRTRKWVGPRQYKRPRHYGYSAMPEPYEGTLPFHRRDLTQDKTGTIAQAIGAWMAQEADIHDETVATALDSNSGAGDTGYDGVAMFSTAHPHLASSAGVSNLSAGTNLTHANYVAARAVGRLITMENGTIGRVLYNAMRVGPLLEGRAKEITGNDTVIKFTNLSGLETTTAANQATPIGNVNKGEVTLYVDDRVTTRYWDLFDLSKPSKPMCLVIERDLQPWEQTDMNSPRRVEHDEFVFGHDGEWIAIPAMFILAYRGTGTA